VYTVESGTVVAANSNTPGAANARIGYNGGTGILTINGVSASVRLSGTNNNLGGGDFNATSGTGTINLSAGELAVNSLTTGTVAGSAGAFNFSGGTLRPFSQNTSIGMSGTGFTIALAGTSATLSGIDASGTSRSLTILTTLVNGTAGAAGLNVSGGTVVLSAANTYSGATTVSSGTLAIGAGGTTGSITGNVANNATLVFNRSNAITYSGTISGSGDILKQAAGQLTLSASNSFTGNTTVNSGTLLLGNQNALRGSTFAGGAGTLAFTSVSSEPTANFYYLGGLSGSSSLSLLDTSGTSIRLNFGFNNADTTFSGNLTNGQGIEKYGTGTTTLSGNISTGAAFGQMSTAQGGLRQNGGTITLNRNNGSGAFTVGVGSGTTGSYVLQSGTLLVASTLGHVRLGANGGTGILTIDGGSARAFFSGTNNTIGGNDLNATSGTGTINLIAGELAVNSLTTGTVAGSTGNFNFAGGTLRPYSQNASIGRIGSGFSIALADSSATFSGLDAAAGTARTLTVLTALVDGTAGAAGAIFSGGTISLSAANTYSGATTIAGANSTLALGANGSFATSPTITVGNAGSSGAILDLTAKTGTFTFTSGQTVGGIGTIKMDAGDTAQFAGTFAPGNSPGILTFDGGTGLLSGTTQIEIFGAARGAGYDAVDLINAATLNYGNGVLALDFGSWLADQQSYQLFGSGSSTLLGHFANVTIAGANYAGLTFIVSNGVWTSQGTSPANQTLTFTEATGTLVIVPEPGAIALAGIGIAAAAWGSRRRR
jgi:autotransporter-associated beta strand protein